MSTSSLGLRSPTLALLSASTGSVSPLYASILEQRHDFDVVSAARLAVDCCCCTGRGASQATSPDDTSSALSTHSNPRITPIDPRIPDSCSSSGAPKADVGGRRAASSPDEEALLALAGRVAAAADDAIVGRRGGAPLAEAAAGADRQLRHLGAAGAGLGALATVLFGRDALAARLPLLLARAGVSAPALA